MISHDFLESECSIFGHLCQLMAAFAIEVPALPEAFARFKLLVISSKHVICFLGSHEISLVPLNLHGFHSLGSWLFGCLAGWLTGSLDAGRDRKFCHRVLATIETFARPWLAVHLISCVSKISWFSLDFMVLDWLSLQGEKLSAFAKSCPYRNCCSILADCLVAVWAG